MIIRRKPPRQLGLKEPIRHENHGRPRTRRDFLGRGLIAGAAYVTAPTFFSLFANPREAYASLATDISTLVTDCGIATQGAGKIPFICFDLAGGANLNGSEALIGGPGGQLDFLSVAGYANLGKRVANARLFQGTGFIRIAKRDQLPLDGGKVLKYAGLSQLVSKLHYASHSTLVHHVALLLGSRPVASYKKSAWVRRRTCKANYRTEALGRIWTFTT